MASGRLGDSLLDPTPAPDVVDREPRSEIRLYDVVAVFFFSAVTGAIGLSIGTGIGGAGSHAETIGSLVGLWAGLIPGSILVCRVRETGSLVQDLGLRFKFPADFIGVVVGLGSQFLLLPIVYALIQVL